MNRQPIQDNKALIKTLQEYSRVGLIYAKVDFRKEEEAAFWGQVEDVEEEGIARYRVKGFRLWHADEVFNTEDDLIKGDLIIPPIGDCDLILHEGARQIGRAHV